SSAGIGTRAGLSFRASRGTCWSAASTFAVLKIGRTSSPLICSNWRGRITSGAGLPYWKRRRCSSVPLSHHSQSLPFDGADAGGAAVDLDTAGDPELFAVEAQYIDGLGQHTLRQERLAGLAPSDALGPTADLGLRGEGELGAVDAIDHEEAALVVGLVGLWPLRPVLDGDGHVRAVGREHSGLGDLADRDGIDDARWVLLQI